MEVERVARYVRQNPADAWVVSAASREILEWFSGQATPALAMYGRSGGLPIAAAYTIMIPGQTAALRRLIDLGHRRIVMLAREERRKPSLSRPEQAFIDELKAAGIPTGDYNLPDWEESREGLGRRLDGLFQYSPPTALVFQEAPIFIAARSHLADRGIVAPRDVSLVVADRDPSFAWCDPIVSHIRWDYRPVVGRVVRWARNVAGGKDDRRQAARGRNSSREGPSGRRRHTHPMNPGAGERPTYGKSLEPAEPLPFRLTGRAAACAGQRPLLLRAGSRLQSAPAQGKRGTAALVAEYSAGA
jgi:DNA-binding LacI/PurR family transcriptional regulator